MTITLTSEEYKAIMKKAENSSVSDLIRKAVFDFCGGGYTPAEPLLNRTCSLASINHAEVVNHQKEAANG